MQPPLSPALQGHEQNQLFFWETWIGFSLQMHEFKDGINFMENSCDYQKWGVNIFSFPYLIVNTEYTPSILEDIVRNVCLWALHHIAVDHYRGFGWSNDHYYCSGRGWWSSNQHSRWSSYCCWNFCVLIGWKLQFSYSFVCLVVDCRWTILHWWRMLIPLQWQDINIQRKVCLPKLWKILHCKW